jgi:hypothetical protein
VSDASSALLVILGWITRNPDPKMTSARANAILYWLHTEASRFSDYSEIANFHGLTKAAISKALLTLKDEVGCRLPVGKRTQSRATYARAQLKAVAEGRHASQSKV